MPKLKQNYKSAQLLLDFEGVKENIFRYADITSIKYSLPRLYDEQHEDVLTAEERFKVGKGILFTNGTGTGKTFVGLGIAKRFIMQGKDNILIIVPTDKKAKDWIEEGELLQMKIIQLEDTKHAVKGISVTTYANFYQNQALYTIIFNLIIYDECHYLLQNQQGNYTNALYKHKEIARLPSSFKENIKEEIQYYCPLREGYTYDKSLYEKIYNDRLTEYIDQTKVVLLSATPFAYHKSLLLGDGCLWDIYEKPYYKETKHTTYNEGDEWEQFLVENLGYRMRYNRAHKPDVSVDVSLMEREFYEKYSKAGIISGRQIKVDKDYSREFISIDSDLGFKIDQGMKIFYEKGFDDKYPMITKFFNKKYTYLYISQLLECIKAREVIRRIKQHLSLDRKIVIFHSYNNSMPEHPFKFNAYDMLKSEDDMQYMDWLIEDIEKFEIEYAHLVNLDLEELQNPIATLTEAFESALLFNGKVPKKKRAYNAEEFNYSIDKNIILVQLQAGKEGISFHDQLKEKQRVLMVLGLPTAPTDAIQIEGRIYRMGLQSNAIYEYLTLQTSFERFAFASKIAERSRTAENLAMGEKARNLELVFKEGYLNATDESPNLQQGTGGKNADNTFEAITEFDKAKTYYFGTGKKTSKNKAIEGIDYFATPEPLGFKMVEWLGMKAGDAALEPSAGHGAIARFFPSNTQNVYIEPSYELASKLSVNAVGNVKTYNFENHHISNKYKGIVMNPPFGKSGKTAMEHIEKAVRHLSRDADAKVIAIIPNGPAMQKRLDYYFNNDKGRDFYIKSELLLPAVLFERAGTTIHSKIIEIRKINENNYKNVIDLSAINTINEFFDEIENLLI